MAMKPLRPCRHPGCGVLVSGGYCAAHQPPKEERRSAESQAWRWMYRTEDWKLLRGDQLLREPFCRECARRGLRRRGRRLGPARPAPAKHHLHLESHPRPNLGHGHRPRPQSRPPGRRRAQAPQIPQGRSLGLTHKQAAGTECRPRPAWRKGLFATLGAAFLN